MGLIRRQSRSGSGAAGRSPGAPVQARLRPVTPAGLGAWLPGSLVLSPGSLLWQPDAGVAASPVELAAATQAFLVPGDPHAPDQGLVTDLETPAGRVHLELDPVLFEMSQELVNGGDPGQ